jgi:hypothetical protein
MLCFDEMLFGDANLNIKISVICIRQPLIVMKQSPKLAILQSLDALDFVQMEEVLTYIKSIVNHSGKDTPSFKKEAMKEIRQALRKGKKGLQLAA